MVNTKQKLHNLITKHKSNLNYDTIVNDLCRLYFEIKEQETEDPKPKPQIEFVVNPILKNSPVGDCLKELENDLITEHTLLKLGFNKKTSIIFKKKVTEYLTVIYNTHNKELSIYDYKTDNVIVLDKFFTKKSELVNLLNLIF